MVFGNQTKETQVPALPTILLWDIRQTTSEPHSPNLLKTQITDRPQLLLMHAQHTVQSLEHENLSKCSSLLLLSHFTCVCMRLCICQWWCCHIPKQSADWVNADSELHSNHASRCMLHQTEHLELWHQRWVYGMVTKAALTSPSVWLTSSWLQASDLPFPRAFILQTCGYKSFLCPFEM